MHTEKRRTRLGAFLAGHGTLLANCAILAVAALVYIALLSPVSVAAWGSGSGVIYRGSAASGVSLQCAVTWDAAAVGPILDILKEEEVCITFAVTGEWAERNPRLLERMRDEGHEIAVTLSQNREDAASAKDELSSAADTIESAVGVRPVTCCAASGDGRACAAGKELGFDTVLCTVDLDCSGADAPAILARLRGRAEPGGIIRLQPTAQACEALPQIIKYLKNMGFAIVPTHKMLYN